MINTETFTARIEKILQKYELSAAAFAEKIEVGRSSVSHILSGRNKPSLDFVLKINHAFPEIDLYWLLKGDPDAISSSPLKKEDTTQREAISQPLSDKEEKSGGRKILPSATGQVADPAIERIVVLFRNGQFKIYENV